ncbi:Protein kinase domain-containing protein [Caenorhabditis elegans]|uniref:Protein kinase domain-containing protein n=1 Tax=Caenorhabditis elegans TaxID=6239 RepID=U4PC52_CAEEL|nr:Protein kinase domain-containing protein [Caenorhabditis elegans]CDH93445.1 Protein kinase domain-containing protein [Caenorhabditis elegans]|eukprot:NP_001293584.1 Uncharacterized protein CELE_F59E12.15 [Caenorhabditis elegans]
MQKCKSEIKKFLGYGASGTAYLVVWEDKEVVMKVTGIHPQSISVLHDELLITQKIGKLSKSCHNFLPYHGSIVISDLPAKMMRNSECVNHLAIFMGYGGTVLADWRTSDYRRCITIMAQLVLAMRIANDKMKFVHGDIYMMNILIAPTTKRWIEYNIDGKTITIQTFGIIPQLIDFSKSWCGADPERHDISRLHTVAKRVGHSLNGSKRDKKKVRQAVKMVGAAKNWKNLCLDRQLFKQVIVHEH